MRSSRLAAALGSLALVFCSVRPTEALDAGEWIPGLKLTPFFAERVTYETNVFQVPSGSQADTIFKTIPGFLADYTFGPHAATLGYRAEILNYVTLTDQNTVNHVPSLSSVWTSPSCWSTCATISSRRATRPIPS